MAYGAYRVPPGLEATILQENAHDDVDQLEERVRSMEALLFKASFQDFQVLDRIVADACAVDVSCHSGKGSVKFPTTNRTPGSNQLFNMYDDDDMTDVGAQTDQATCYDKGVQTKAMTKPRKSRVNGRATQTEQVPIDSSCDTKVIATATCEQSHMPEASQIGIIPPFPFPLGSAAVIHSASGCGSKTSVNLQWEADDIETWIRETMRIANSTALQAKTRKKALLDRQDVIDRRWQEARPHLSASLQSAIWEILCEPFTP